MRRLIIIGAGLIVGLMTLGSVASADTGCAYYGPGFGGPSPKQYSSKAVCGGEQFVWPSGPQFKVVTK